MPWVRPASSSALIDRTAAARVSSSCTSCSVGPVIVQVATAVLVGSTCSQVPVRSRSSSRTCSASSSRTPATTRRTMVVNALGARASHGPTRATPSSGGGGSSASTAFSTTASCAVCEVVGGLGDRAGPGQVDPARVEGGHHGGHRPAQPVGHGHRPGRLEQRDTCRRGDLARCGVVEVGLGERGRPQHRPPHAGAQLVLVASADAPGGHPDQPQVVRVGLAPQQGAAAQPAEDELHLPLRVHGENTRPEH